VTYCNRRRATAASHFIDERGALRLGGALRFRDGPPNGSVVKLHGQGLRGYGSAARRLPACETRDAGGVTPCKLR